MLLLIAAGFAALTLLFVLLAALSRRRFPLEPFVCLSAGGLISVTFLHFLPASFKGAPHFAGAIALAGFFIQGLFDLYGVRRLSFLDRLLLGGDSAASGRSSHSHSHSHSLSASGVCSIAGCLALCAFFDGVRLYSGLLLPQGAAIVTALSVFFHLFSEGAMVAFLGIDLNIKKKPLLVLICLIAGAFLLGAILAQSMLAVFDAPFLLAFESGILTYICLIHLLPVSLKPLNRKWFALGASFFFFLHLAGG